MAELYADARRIWPDLGTQLGRGPSGVDLHRAHQQDLLSTSLPYVAEFFSADRAGSEVRRDELSSGAFGPVDAALLEAYLRWLRPARVIEVGCGHSSAAMLDADSVHLVTSVSHSSAL